MFFTPAILLILSLCSIVLTQLPPPPPGGSPSDARLRDINLFQKTPLVGSRVRSADDNVRMGLTIQRHSPCRNNGEVDRAQSIIIFPSADDAAITADAERPGCYSITGPVIVKRDIRGSLQIYAETRSTARRDVRPDECLRPNPITGCGGFGSCVYCAKCSDDVDALGKISIRKAGRDLQCNANPNQGRDTLLLKSGVHNDIELSFCMPTKSDVKDAFELDDETWAALTTAQGEGSNPSARFVLMRMYVFNFDVARIAKATRTRYDSMRKQRDARLRQTWMSRNTRRIGAGLAPEPEPVYGLPLEVSEEDYNKERLHVVTHEEKLFLSCHQVGGLMYYNVNDIPLRG